MQHKAGAAVTPKVNGIPSDETGKIGRDPDIQVLVGRIESVTGLT